MLPLCLIMVSLCLVSLLEVGATVSCFAQEAYNVWLQRHKVILCRTQVFPVKCRIYGLVLSICRKSNCGNSAHAEAMEVHLHVFLRKTTVSLMTLKETVEFTTNKKTHQKKKKKNTPKTRTQVIQTVAWSAFCLTSLQRNSLYAITSVFSRTETKFKGKHYRVQPALLVYVDYQQTILAPS